MFTGIVQEIGTLRKKKEDNNKFQLVIAGSKVLKNIKQGESIAVNGICLTVISCTDSFFTADVMPETLRNTNLNKLKKGAKVNLEQAVRPDSFFSGHLVTGHIDGTGTIKKIKREYNSRIIEVKINSKLEKFMVDKGSVTINGVSLTIVRVDRDNVAVSLIPETWRQTIFKFATPGVEVNIETDMIGKYVVKMMRKQTNFNPNLNKDFLRENGFL